MEWLPPHGTSEVLEAGVCMCIRCWVASGTPPQKIGRLRWLVPLAVVPPGHEAFSFICPQSFIMKLIWASWVWGALLCIASDVIRRQSPAASSTTSVFSIPTPTSAQTINGSDHDLSKKFCRLWRHQSTLHIIPRKLGANSNRCLCGWKNLHRRGKHCKSPRIRWTPL